MNQPAGNGGEDVEELPNDIGGPVKRPTRSDQKCLASPG